MDFKDKWDGATKGWVAGVISTSGMLTNRRIIRSKKAGRTLSARFELRSKKHAEVVHRLAKYLGHEVRSTNMNYDKVPTIILWGDELHQVMTAIWPYLTKERMHEYAAIKRASDESALEED